MFLFSSEDQKTKTLIESINKIGKLYFLNELYFAKIWGNWES